ncbi:MAG: response regulator [Algicola sp.]|nr:response regulator [Algicola sp.]
MSSRILLIDDDAIVHKIAQRQIGKEYELFHAHSAKEGLELIQSKKPHLILLDIEMPETNGYQLCKQIRADKQYDNVSIVFLSGKSAEKDIMLGYELGADDYIVKPFHVDILLKTIKVLEQNQSKNAALRRKTAQTKDKTPSNAEPANELAQVMSFIDHSHRIDCLETLANQFFALTNNWALKCSAMFSHTGTETFFANNNVIKPLEKQILMQTKNSNRTLQFGNRMVVIYPNISVLVKNMPPSSSPKYDFYKTCLPSLIGTINAKVLKLLERQSIDQQTQQLTDAFIEIKDKLVNLVALLNSKNGSMLKSIKSTSKQIDQQLQLLNLPAQAQQQLKTITHSLLDKISSDTTNASSANKDLAMVILNMQEVVSQQQTLAKKIHQQRLTVNEVRRTDNKADVAIEA